jgi:hypothetical protein
MIAGQPVRASTSSIVRLTLLGKSISPLSSGRRFFPRLGLRGSYFGWRGSPNSSSKLLNCLRTLASVASQPPNRRVKFGALSARDNPSAAASSVSVDRHRPAPRDVDRRRSRRMPAPATTQLLALDLVPGAHSLTDNLDERPDAGVAISSILKLSAQPRTPKPPVPFDGNHGNTERPGDLGDGHAAEVPQGDDLAQTFINQGQLVERLVDRHDIEVL